MKHRLQGDKKPLTSDGWSSGLIREQPRRNPRLQGEILSIFFSILIFDFSKTPRAYRKLHVLLHLSHRIEF